MITFLHGKEFLELAVLGNMNALNRIPHDVVHKVVITEGALVGVGGTVAPGVSIGACAPVCASAVAIRPMSPGVTVVGAPAKPLQR